MEYKVQFDEAKDICTIRVTGRHKRPQDSMILQKLARDVGRERGCLRFLFDMTGAEIVGSTLETYQTGTVPVDLDRKQVRQRIALLYAGDLTNHRFMETVAVNRGYRLRVFNRRDRALDWLRSEESED